MYLQDVNILAGLGWAGLGWAGCSTTQCNLLTLHKIVHHGLGWAGLGWASGGISSSHTMHGLAPPQGVPLNNVFWNIQIILKKF